MLICGDDKKAQKHITYWGMKRKHCCWVTESATAYDTSSEVRFLKHAGLKLKYCGCNMQSLDRLLRGSSLPNSFPFRYIERR